MDRIRMKDDRQAFDETRHVLTVLRSNCGHTKSANKVIKIVTEKTGLPRERVKEIIIELFKDKEEK